jgi:transposase
MLTQEQGVEIRVLARQGKTIREIARILGLSRNTVRRYLRGRGTPRYAARPPRPQKLDPFKAYLAERVRQAHPAWLPATVLLREIQDQGDTGGLTRVRRYLRTLKPARKDAEPSVRFETAPGRQMPVDFIMFRQKQSPLSACVATLGYSRLSFVRFSTQQEFETVREGLVEAFVYFGGVPPGGVVRHHEDRRPRTGRLWAGATSLPSGAVTVGR